MAEFEQFRLFKAKKEAEERRKANRDTYAAMVDNEVRTAIPLLLNLSGQIKGVKEEVIGNFKAILEMKRDVMGLTEEGQRSHTFTTGDGKYRLTLGQYALDGYRDTVEEGIAMVRGYIESLARDETSKALVSAVIRLLSRDQAGNIKASRVLQLRKMAEETGDARFLEGVRIIEESYQPTVSKRFIRAEMRNEAGGWVAIPLSVTDAE